MGWLRHGWSRETDTWTPQEMTNVTFGNLYRNVSFSRFSLLLSANVVGAESVSSFSHFQKKKKNLVCYSPSQSFLQEAKVHGLPFTIMT